MGFSDHRYSIEVKSDQAFDGSSQNGVVATGVLCRVYDAGTTTASTIYADNARTAKTNPISRSQFATDGGTIEFYSPNTSHTISVMCSDGSVGRFTVTPNTRAVSVISSGVQKLLVCQFGASDNTETDTGDDLPYKAWVQDCYIEVTAADSGETIDVGLLSTETAGDANGFLAAASVASTGIVANRTYTAGSNETYISAITYGALMGTSLAGSDAATDEGINDQKGHIVVGSNAVSVSYTGSAGSDTAAGFIYIPFIQLP